MCAILKSWNLGWRKQEKNYNTGVLVNS